MAQSALSSGVERLLGRWRKREERRGAAAQDPAPADSSPEPGGGAPRSESALLGELGVLLAAREAIPAGQINIIGLDHLRARLGDRWGDLCGVVREVCERTIRRHLGQGDIFHAVDDDHFLVIFASLGEEAARLKCAMMAREIGARILGDEGAEELTIRSAVGRVGGALAFRDFSLADLLAELDAHSVVLDAADWSDAAGAPGSRAQSDADRPTAPPLGGALGLLLSASAWSGRGESVALPSFDLTPIWDVRAGSVSNYRVSAEQAWIDLVRRPDGSIDGAAGAAIDLQGLREAVLALYTSAHHDSPYLATATLHFETLARAKSRAGYLELMQRLPMSIRRNLLLELAAVPAGVPVMRLEELLIAVRPFCRAVLIDLGSDAWDLGLLKRLGVFAVGRSHADLGEDAAQAARRLRAFAGQGERHRLWTYLQRLHSPGQAKAAIEAGVRFLEGEAIARHATPAQGAVRFRLEDYLAGGGEAGADHQNATTAGRSGSLH